MQESNLMNVRLTWLLTIHGFLYATYGLTIQKQLEQSKAVSEGNGKGLACYVFGQTEVFLLVIAAVGICISLLGFRSIRAAQKSSHAAYYLFSQHKLFKEQTQPYVEPISRRRHTQIYRLAQRIQLPDIRGGGIEDNVRQGQAASWAIPLILMTSWLISIAFTIITWYHNFHFICI